MDNSVNPSLHEGASELPDPSHQFLKVAIVSVSRIELASKLPND